MQNQKGFIPIVIFVTIALLLGAGIYLAAVQENFNVPKINPTPTACTQEAKLCPDGSYVGRSGSNCEFAQCPDPNPTIISKKCPPGTIQTGQTNSIPPSPICEPTPVCEYAAPPLGCNYIEGPNYNEQTMCGLVLKCSNENQVTLKEGQKDGSLLVQKIYSDYITGIHFMAYPVGTSEGQPITLRVGETASNGCDVRLTLVSIKGDSATFTKRVDLNKNCPICLAENTLIDTPSGQIAVQDLKEGMQIWTVDEFGARIVTTIAKTSKTPVPPTHQMIHVILEDGREIFASPGHPIGDGRVFNDLSAGGILDGSKIVTAEKTTYDKNYTYDILPTGQTGFYFAGHSTAPGFDNGILIGSTLK
ncbi:MAG: hypothetical protein EXS52_02005 [Candidatus Staskawiczbacteria bacterium]|nr:hypothetical protein [Candidatus Staskawiczbacteria bacterium]